MITKNRLFLITEFLKQNGFEIQSVEKGDPYVEDSCINITDSIHVQISNWEGLSVNQIHENGTMSFHNCDNSMTEVFHKLNELLEVK